MSKGSITIKYLEELGLDKEVAAKIFAERGKEIAETNAEKAELERLLSESKNSNSSIMSELESLRAVSADGADWKAKFEALQADILAKEKQAEADKILKEKQASVEKRFNDVVGDKQFNHEAIREAYLKKFGEALESKDFEGKGDSDIFKELTQNDGSAFKGVVFRNITGGQEHAQGYSNKSVKDIMKSDMTREEKRQAIAENIARGKLDYGSRN